MVSLKGFGQSVYLFSKMDIYKCPIFKNADTLPNSKNLPQYNKLIFLLKEINDATLPRGDNNVQCAQFQRLAGGFSLFVFQKRNKLLLIAALHTMFCSTFSKSGFTLWKKRAKPRRAFGILHLALL